MSEKIVEQRREHIRNMRICRLCLCRDKPLINVHERSTLSVPLAVQIMACLQIEVYPTDGLPPSICTVCRYFVQQSYAFRHVTIRGERALADVLQTGVYSGAIPYPDDMIQNMNLAMANMKKKQEKEYAEESQVLDIQFENQSDATLNADEKQVKSKKDTATINVMCQGDELHISAEPPEGSGDEEQVEEEEEEELEDEEEDEEELESEEVDLDTSYEAEGFACNQCDRAFPLSQLLKLHVKQHHRRRDVACDICSQRFFTKYDLMTHMLVHTGAKPFRCVLCRAAFSRLTLLKRHEKVVHPDAPKLHCSECTLTFLSEDELEAHRSKHRLYQTRPFACTDCPKKFHRKQGLTRHVLSVHKNAEATYKCEYCPEGFMSLSKLTRHVQGHASRPYPCKYCDKTFLKSHHYTRHLRHKHNQAPSVRGVNTTSDMYKCEQCDETFQNKDDLIYHSAIHATQDLTCPLCKEHFPDIDAVTQHVKSHMSGDQFMCELCQLIFTSETRLEQHMEEEHEEETEEQDDDEEMEEDELAKNEESENYSMEVGDDFSEDKTVPTNRVKKETHQYTLSEASNAASKVRPAQESTKTEENRSEVIYTELKTIDTIKIAQASSRAEAKKEESGQKTSEASPQKMKCSPSTTDSAQKLDKAKQLVENMKGVTIHLQRVSSKPATAPTAPPARRPALTRAESERLGERRARHERGKEKIAQKRMSSTDEGVEAKKPALAKAAEDKRQTLIEKTSDEIFKKLPEIVKKPVESPKKLIEAVSIGIASTKTVEELKKQAETTKKPVETPMRPAETGAKILEQRKLAESVKKPSEAVKKPDKAEEKPQPVQKSNDKSLKMLEKDLLELQMGARASSNTPGRSSGRSLDRQTDGRKEKTSSASPQASSTPMRKQIRHGRDSVQTTPASSRSSSPMFSPPHAKSQNSKPTSAKKDSVAANNGKSGRDSTPAGNALTKKDNTAGSSGKGTPAGRDSTAGPAQGKSAPQRRKSIATPGRKEPLTNKNGQVKEEKGKAAPTSASTPTNPTKKALGIAARASEPCSISGASPRRSSRPCRVKDYAKMIKNNASTDEEEETEDMEAEGESETEDAEEETGVPEEKNKEDGSTGTETEVKEDTKNKESDTSMTDSAARRGRGRPRKSLARPSGRGRGRGRGGARGRTPRDAPERSLTEDDTDFSDDGDDEYELPKERKTRKVYTQQRRASVVGMKVRPSISTPGAPPSGAPSPGAPSGAPTPVTLATPPTHIVKKLTPVTPPATIAQQAAAMRLQGSPAKQGAPTQQGVSVQQGAPTQQGSPDTQGAPTSTPAGSPAQKLLVMPSGQTLTPVPSPTALKNLPLGAKPTTLPPGKSILQGIGAGQLVDMQLGQRKVKVQKIVMSKQEVERMAKSGMLEMKDGAMVLKSGYKLPASFKSQAVLKPQTPAPTVKQEDVANATAQPETTPAP